MSESNDALSILQRHMQTQADLQSLAQAGMAISGGPLALMKEWWDALQAAEKGSMAHATLLGRGFEIFIKAGEKRQAAPVGADMDQEQLAAVIKQLVPQLGVVDGQAKS